MKLTVQTKLLPNAEQADVLLRTLEAANAAADAISARAWSERTFQQFSLHRLVYADMRAETGLSAQMVVRLIAKVADAYKLDRARQRRFNRCGSIAYDERILRWKAAAVSIWTVDGRQTVPYVCGERQRELLAHQQGESDLVFRDGEWYLYATVEYTEPPESEIADWVGVDLGIVNIAVTSDGAIHAGGQVIALRHRHRKLRQRLQQKGTKSAKRLLRRRRVKEARFGTWVNHTISKRIVADCEGTTRGIVLEDLKHIRTRVTARRSQRATLHSWSFGQLQAFLTYKSRMRGVPVQFVDPRNTSRRCPACGHTERGNRPSQATFLCKSCGLADLADLIAARNLSALGRATVNSPYAGESVETQHASPESRLL
ncbi:MAG: transposase [Chloroflexota bacterium]